MKEQLTHILDQSVCLSRKQMKEYLSGSMLPEEVHAAELHISSCPLCSMAMEGFEEHSEDALAAIASLNSGFLKEHFDNIAPQIHLNSMAPSAALSHSGRRRTAIGPWLRPTGIAAGLLLICAAAWYVAKQPARQTTAPEIASATAAQPAAAPENTSGNSVQSPRAAAPATAPAAVPAAKAAAPEPAVKPAKTTIADKNTLAYKDQNGTAHYYQPEPMPAEDPAVAVKAATEALPSANDPSKTYKGAINMRTTKMYVPPSSETTDAMALTAPATKPAVAARPPAAETAPPENKPEASKRSEESSDQLFERGEYRSALSKYRQQLKSADADTRNRASLQAARCYAALGEPDRAEALLRKVMDEGNNHDRRTARRLLRNLR